MVTNVETFALSALTNPMLYSRWRARSKKLTFEKIRKISCFRGFPRRKEALGLNKAGAVGHLPPISGRRTKI
ncbi:MAG TPA: hypothetical protein D7H89_03010 [Candidatus Poseidoniales archaeon]|nr:MAG TPA: hypothetical protein D7H89_03010 [Candidatus Poseidoniales archaeon]